MFGNKSLRYSFEAQKREKHRVLRTTLLILAVFVLSNLIGTFAVSVWVVRGQAMQTGIRPGDRLLVVSSALPFLFSGGKLPYERGSLVLVDRGRERPEGGFRGTMVGLADTAVRFFTAQQVSLFGRAADVHLKRLVAVGGDEASMEGFILRVRPAGGRFPLTEFEFAGRPYYPSIPQNPALWDGSLPFSGNLEPFRLASGECFLLSDDRAVRSDSRSWGPVSARSIVGRPVFRFWPPSRIGLP